MSLYARGSFTGNYLPRGDISEADCVIGHEFAYRAEGFGFVNEALARFIAQRYINMPLFLNRNIAGALEDIHPDAQIEGVFNGISTNLTATNGEGTWGELRQARQFMDKHGLERPVLVAQAFHVGRVALQAEKQGIDPIVPEGLPREFDRRSKQIWTQAWPLWVVHEALGVPVLRKRDQI